MGQLDHDQVMRHRTDFPLVLVCDGVNGPANIGSLLRLADGFGVKEVIFSNAAINMQSDRMKRTARGSEKWVNWREESDLINFLRSKLKSGAFVWALEITDRSTPLAKMRVENTDKEIVMVIGGENRGVSSEVLQLIEDQVYHLPLFGRNSSINVSQAAAIGLYHIVRQFQTK